MINRKEFVLILIIGIILTFSVVLIEDINNFPEIFIIFLITILINIFAKKIVGYYLDSEVEIKLWETQRTGFYPSHKLSSADRKSVV